MKYFAAMCVVAENFKPDCGLAGLEFNECFFRCRVLDHNWTYPDDISDSLHFPSGSYLSGLPGQLKICDPRQCWNVGHMVVVDEEIPVVECLFKKLTLESGLIAVNHGMHARCWRHGTADRGSLRRPVPLVRKGIGRQRDSLSPALGL